MWILGIETSGREGTVALVRDGALIAERTLQRTGRRHAQTLVAELDHLLRGAGVSPMDVAAVAVSVGPGSFTGLRIGVVCAKTLAYATGGQLIAVDTLRAVAENCPPQVGEVFVISDAQRGDVYVGRYHRGCDGWFERAGAVTIAEAETWCAARAANDVVSGPGLDRFIVADSLRESASTGGASGSLSECFAPLLTGRCRVRPVTEREPRAAVVARIGERSLARGETADVWSLEPFYLRKSYAEEAEEIRKQSDW